jgi:hypothetical protein
MGKARDKADAEQQAVEEHWQCQTCDKPAQEHSVYCMHCQMYWADVANGVFDDDQICGT